MKIKDKVRKKMEKAFKDAGFNGKITLLTQSDDVYAIGCSLPIKTIFNFTARAEVDLKESDIELEVGK